MRIFKDKKGVTSIEYCLIASLIAVVIIGAVIFVHNNVSSNYDNIASSMQKANTKAVSK